MTNEQAPSEIKDKIRTWYRDLAKAVSSSENVPHASACCALPAADQAVTCGPAASRSCCSASGVSDGVARQLYTEDDLRRVPKPAALASFGCGNPLASVRLVPGETVLDLGSGGGIDVLLSAQRVGPTGKVYGLDLTDEMLNLARESQRRAGVENVEFLRGDIEDIPLPDGSVDVVISNCVINLATDKTKVFREAYRVLRPGGRLSVSDTVFQGDRSRFPEEISCSAEARGGCVAGALEEEDYVGRLREVGFVGVDLQVTGLLGSASACSAPDLPAGARLTGGVVRARKPGSSSFLLRGATAADLPAVERLVAEANLPLEGLPSQFPAAYQVGESAGRVVGVAGLEIYGRDGLLRSVVVDTPWRGLGVGRALVVERLDQARARGLRSAYLLTVDAAAYFTRLGFEPAGREGVPTEVAGSAEFAHACPATAAVLALALT